MIRTAWVVGLALAFLACTACKKNDDKKAADKPAGSAAEAKIDPWAGDAPTGAGTTLGASTGGALSRIDHAHDVGAASLAAKVEVGSIAKPDAPKLAIKGFGAVAPSGFTVTYNASSNAVHEQFRTILQTDHVFEAVAESLNKTVRMPSTVAIQLVDCNTVNAFYDPNTHRIIVCYELLDYFLDVFKPTAKSQDELGNSVIGATMFSFYHEAGHGLIHMLDLPAVGREEDSVDQLATITLIAMGDEGVGMAMSGAYWFQLQATKAGHETPFWDEHAFDGQRFYNIMCLIYGSNPDKYAKFVDNGNLPADRAKRCPEEYTKINKAWEKLLQPFLTNGAAVNVDYKPSVPLVEAPKTSAKDPWGDSASGDSTPTVTAGPAEAAPQDPNTHTVTCEAVATRAAELVAKQAQAQALSMSATEVDELKRRLETQLPAMIEQVISECAKAEWSNAARQCVIDATTLDQATKCGT